MITNDNPYRSPRVEAAGDAPHAPFRRAIRVFLAWIAVASLVGGAALAWTTAHALARFSSEVLTVALVTLSALRGGAAQASSAAAGIALVAGTHHRSAAGAELRAAWPPWRIYALVPPAWPLAAGLMIGAGVLVSVAYGVDAATCWRRVLTLAVPGDLVFGTACASLDALLLGALATAAVPRLAGVRAGLVVKVVAVLVATGMIGGAVRAVLGACLPDGS